MKRLIILCLLALSSDLYSQGALVDPSQVAANGPQVREYNFSTFPSFEVAPDLEELAQMTPEDQYSHPEYGTVPYRTQCKDCIELIDRRTVDSRYFVRSGTEGQTFYVQQIYGQLHYEDENGWLRTIDPRVRPLNAQGLYGAPEQPRPTFYDHSDGFSGIESPQGTLRYNGLTHLLTEDANGAVNLMGALNHQNMMIGEDGVMTLEAWPGIDREQIFKEGEIKTNFILKTAPQLPANAKWLVFQDHFELPPGHQLVRDNYSGAETVEGYWTGDLVLENAQGEENFRLRRPVMTDANRLKYGRVDLLDDPTATYIAYEHQVQGNTVILSIMVNADWLRHPGRIYPVKVDPLVTGTGTYAAGQRGLRYDGTCWNATNYCSHTLNVNVPGNSTLTDAYFDAQYISESWGCGIFVDCWMSEAAFRMVGPCGNSPPSPLYWTCLSPGGDAPGTCSGVGNPAFQTVSCLPPQCPNYSINFEMRGYYCFCSSSGCPTGCQRMPNNSWVVTVEARTIESAATANSVPVTSNGSCNVAQTVSANPNFGVPGYSYNWNTGPSQSSPSQSVTHTSNGTYTYQCTVTDNCGQTSVSSVNVVISDCPFPVEMANITGEVLEQSNMLYWETASEMQLDRFVVEKSFDGDHFSMIGEVRGVNEPSGSSYRFEDEWAISGKTYYRLKIVDEDGAINYSEVVSLDRVDSGERLLITYPTGREEIALNWQGKEASAGEVRLYSIQGKVINRYEYQEDAGAAMSLAIPTQSMSPGAYFLRWKGQNHKILIR